MMLILSAARALLTTFLAGEGLALGLLAAVAASTVEAYLWRTPAFVVDGSIMGGGMVLLLWSALQNAEEEHPWGS
jgi:formate/nitrite transporter FocA (FNT family)